MDKITAGCSDRCTHKKKCCHRLMSALVNQYTTQENVGQRKDVSNRGWLLCMMSFSSLISFCSLQLVGAFWREIRADCLLQVHITGKYGVRYGASLRKQIKKIEITQHAKYTCGCKRLESQALQFWTCTSRVNSCVVIFLFSFSEIERRKYRCRFVSQRPSRRISSLRTDGDADE